MVIKFFECCYSHKFLGVGPPGVIEGTFL